METITKRIITREITEFVVRCDKCQKEIRGASEGHARFNLMIHKESKECKKMKETHEEFMKRIIEESREPTLPERTHDALNVGGESQ